MTFMEKFYELFRRDLWTERLEMRILEPTPENAELVWDVVKNENPEDYKYMWFSVSYKSNLTVSLQETLEKMKFDSEFKNGCMYYIFHDGKFIGYMRIHYYNETQTLQCSNVWFIKSARGHGFNQEVHRKLEDLAFNALRVNRVCRQAMVDNIESRKSIESSGYHFDGVDRQASRMSDGTFMDDVLYSKLASEYESEKTGE